MLLFFVAPDVGPINSSLRVLSVDVSGGRVSFTLAFDVSDLLLKMSVCIGILECLSWSERMSKYH